MSDNLTYSESGFNPAGSLRYTMLGGSSNLCGSIYNGMQSGSTAGGAIMQKGTLSSGGSMQFLQEDGGSLNFSNTTSFIRGSNATGGSATHPPPSDDNYKV